MVGNEIQACLDISKGFLEAAVSLAERGRAALSGAVSCQHGYGAAAVSSLLPATLEMGSWQEWKGLAWELPPPLPREQAAGR